MPKNISQTLRKRLPILLKKHTASKIAERYGVSKELVRQLIVKAGGYKPEYKKWKHVVDSATAEKHEKVAHEYIHSDQRQGSITRLSRKYGLPYSTVQTICKKLKRNNKGRAGENGDM